MALLGALSNPQLSQGLLGMAAGLLTPGNYGAFGPSLGRGLLGFSTGSEQGRKTEQGAQTQSILNQYRNIQMQAAQQGLKQQQQRQALIGSLLGIPYQQPAEGQSTQSTGILGAQQQPSGGLLNAAQAFPVSDAPATPTGTPAAPAQSAIPESIRTPALFDLMFNDGKGIAALMKPSFQNVRPGGTVYDATTGTVRFSAPTSEGTQVVYDENGKPHISLLPGASNAAATMSTAKARGPASFRTQTVNAADGTNVLTTDAALSDQINNQPAPVRNNNPGALMPGGKLASFSSMDEGLRALDGNLARYGQQGIDTVSGVISKWAPPSENDTRAYIDDVSRRLGITPDQKIDLSSPLVRQALGAAIAIHENGVQGVFGHQGQPSQQVPGIQVQNEGMTAANTALGKAQATALIDSRKAAVTATDDITNIEQARRALAGGTFGGSGAQAKLNAVKFLQGWVPGLENLDASRVTNTDYLVSTLGRGLLTHAKDLGYNPTDADASRIEAIIGTIGKDPRALSNLLDYQQMMAQRAITRHNKLVSQASDSGLNSAFDMSVSPSTGMPGTTDPGQPSGFKIVGVR